MSFTFSCARFPIFAPPCDSSRSNFPMLRRFTSLHLHLRKDLFPSMKCEGSSSSVDLAETHEANSVDPKILEKVVLPVEDDAKIGSISSPGPGDEMYDTLPYLLKHREHLDYRFTQYKHIREMIDEQEGGLEAFSRGYEKLGFTRSSAGITYREWAPAAKSAALVGDFNNWNPNADVMTQNEFGIWELFLPNNTDGSPPITHGSRVKIRMDTLSGVKDSIPAWIKFSVQPPGELSYSGIYYDPLVEEKYAFKHTPPEKPRSLRIYEALIGISDTDLKINTYAVLRDDILPRIKNLGYNAVQLTGIQEHSRCANSRYHVTNFFAPCSRYGTPDDLKSLVDKAHELGLFVLMDIVHSHASNSVLDGLNMFDGTDGHYFHSGSRGCHDLRESRLFNYGNLEVLRFLLSNARWWLDEYKFDGFRFDGVTSMMYTHHGLQVQFTGNYKEYFGSATDVDAMVYLMLVHDVIHGLFPEAITLGEDVSGMPTFCFPVRDGGVGFDYRLNTGIAQKWIEILKEKDNNWQMDDIITMLAGKGWWEKCIAYAGSHDEALVRENTLAFRLMDEDMHDFMTLDIPSNPVIERGIALHKMIRLIIMGSSEGYLNFMGNEFGHPGFLSSDKHLPDERAVPRGDSSFSKSSGFDLGDADNLRYRGMKEFDRAMQHLEDTYGFLTMECRFELRMYDDDSVISFVRGDLVFVFNFHWKQSYSKLRVGCSKPGKYRVVLDSDDKKFGGLNRIDKNVDHLATEGYHNGLFCSFVVNSPCRTAVVYALVEDEDEV